MVHFVKNIFPHFHAHIYFEESTLGAQHFLTSKKCCFK